jgi:hypothetical protein
MSSTDITAPNPWDMFPGLVLGFTCVPRSSGGMMEKYGQKARSKKAVLFISVCH